MPQSQHRIAETPRQIVERVSEFLQEGDLEGIVTLFHPDCRIAMDPAEPPLEGHGAVRTIFAEFARDRACLTGTVTGEMINGTTAILQGSWTIEDENGVALMEGVSTEVAVQLAHGGWVYYIDCPFSVPLPQ